MTGSTVSKWLGFGLSAEQEQRYRWANLGADVAQAKLCVWLTMVPVVALWFNDYAFCGLSTKFYELTALRLGLLASTVLLLRYLGRVKSPGAYDRAVPLWGVGVAVFLSVVAASRPHAYLGHVIVAVIAVSVALLVVPNRFVTQVALSWAVTAGEILAVPFAHESVETALVVVVSLVLVNAVGTAASWQLHLHRRREFLAREEMESELVERRRAEEALGQSEERFRTLFETMQETFALVDVVTDETGQPVDFRYRDANPVAERHYHFSAAQLVGQTHREMMASIGQDPQEDWIAVVGRVGLTGEVANGERYVPLAGCWQQYHAFSPRHGQCAVLGIDITERRRAEEEIRSLIAGLEAANRELQALYRSEAEAHAQADDACTRLREANGRLEEALVNVRTLRGLLPICAACKKIRDDQGYWHQVEVYILEHTDAQFSHGMCPACFKEWYPAAYEKMRQRGEVE